jgi:RimJ/RimL family protein N-acetyltransferase
MNVRTGSSAIFLDGKNVYLRPLLKSDITQRYVDWMNDAEVTRFMVTGVFPVTKRDLENYYRAFRQSKTDLLFAIIEKSSKRHIGNIKLGAISWIHRFADLGIVIGDKQCWGKGYGSEACRLLLSYAFGRLNLNKITLGVYGTHKSAIAAYKKVGFRAEGRIRKLLILDGEYVDQVLMGILRDDYLDTLRGEK